MLPEIEAGRFYLNYDKDRCIIGNCLRYNRDLAHHINHFIHDKKHTCDNADKVGLELYLLLHLPVSLIAEQPVDSLDFSTAFHDACLHWEQWEHVDRIFSAEDPFTKIALEKFFYVIHSEQRDGGNVEDNARYRWALDNATVQFYGGTIIDFIPDKAFEGRDYNFAEWLTRCTIWRFLLVESFGGQATTVWERLCREVDSEASLLCIITEMLSENITLSVPELNGVIVLPASWRDTKEEEQALFDRFTSPIATLCKHVNNGHMDTALILLLKLCGVEYRENDSREWGSIVGNVDSVGVEEVCEFLREHADNGSMVG